MTPMLRRLLVSLVVLAVVGGGTASAQVFGTFTWQMQPYCNLVTLTLTQVPGGYTIDGHDNQCGAVKVAGAGGMALINPDGTVGLEFTIVTAPAGKAVHVSASLSPATGSGPWNDSVGNSGTLALGAPGSGSPRPLPASGLAAGVITTTELAAGAVAAVNINSAEVQARVTGSCPGGQFMTAVNASGTVACSGTARSGQIFTGMVSSVIPNPPGDALLSVSFPLPLPSGTPMPVFEYRTPGTVSTNCPGPGRALPGRFCLYGEAVNNLLSTILPIGVAAPHGLYGFVMQAFAATAAARGSLIASWAYQVP